MTSVLVTGGAGFIGHHFVEYLLKHNDYRITILDRLDESGNLNRLADIGAAHDPRVRFVYHDLRAPMNTQVINQIGWHDYVVHMAAGTHVDRSIADPLAFVMDNVVATCNLLQFARSNVPKRFLYFSTDEVFGPCGEERAGFREWDRYKSGNPYAATKAGGEELALAFHNTYGVPVVITHTMNVVGRRQHWEKFVPGTIGKVLKREKVLIHANADLTQAGSRFYISADDVASMVHTLLGASVPGEKYNIVGAEEVDNLQMARRIAAAVGLPLDYELVDFHSSRPGHDLRYALNGEKLRDLWNFAPTLNLIPIVNWYLQRPDWLAPGCKELLQ